MKKSIITILFLALPFIVNNHYTYSQTNQDSVTIMRDNWGIPHIYAENEWALFYGAGYAAAEDRLFQMTLARRSIQGRLSEIFGKNYLDWDKRMRTLGLYNHAKTSLLSYPIETQKLLEAYAEGVNAYIASHPEHLSELFTQYGGAPEPWKPEDCIACWMRIQENFDRGWMNEVSALRKFEPLADSLGRDEAIAQSSQRVVDEEAVIVSKEEYERYSLNNLKSLTCKKDFKDKKEKLLSEWEPPKMSHNWVVAGAKSTTGLPILESDPQIAVEFPATWYEFHLIGGRFNVRGISVPGTPAMLIGYNENLAWGLTALGSDNADLFQEQMRQGSRTEYKWLDGWETLQERKETINIKGAASEVYTIKTTRHGPIVNDFVTGDKPDETFALKYLVTSDIETTVEGCLQMMAAVDYPSFAEGMLLYRSPGVHLIYADKYDNIAYKTLAQIPLRAHNAQIPYQGWTGDEEWRGIVPFDSMPRMLNPLCNFISTANNAPIGLWYPYDIGGGIGDNARSWRLREILSGIDKFSPKDFFKIHTDAIDPIVRDFVKFGLIAAEEENSTDPDVLAARAMLKDWDYRMLTSSPAYPIVANAGTVIKRSIRGTPLENRYLGSDAGLAQLFRGVEAYWDSTGKLTPDVDIRNWLISQLGEVYRKRITIRSGDSLMKDSIIMKYQNNLEGWGSLYRQYDMTSEPLHCGVVSTIWSQKGNSFSQIVNFAEIDSSYTMIPPGNSEIPGSRHFNDQLDLWLAGDMHISPLHFNALENIKESEYKLYINPTEVNDNLFPDNRIELMGCYPNPFKNHIFITIKLNISSNIKLSIFDIYGQEVSILKDGILEPGNYNFIWEGKDNTGAKLPNGVYFCRLAANKKMYNEKIVLLK